MSEPGLFAVSKETQARLKRRYRSDQRFRAYGLAAIIFAIGALVTLLVSIVTEATSAFTRHELRVELVLDPEVADPRGERDPEDIRRNVSGFSDLVRASMRRHFPETAEDLGLRRQLGRMVSTLAASPIAEQAARDPSLIGGSVTTHIPVSDVIDLYLKGLVTRETVTPGTRQATIARGPTGTELVAPGAFAGARTFIAEAMEQERDRQLDAAAIAEGAITRSEAQKSALLAERAALEAASQDRVRAEASDALVGEDDLVRAIALAAGSVMASADTAALRSALTEKIDREIAAAQTESTGLARKGADYAGRADRAALRGDPAAETRRVQSRAAYLAADRRQVEATLLTQQRDDLANLSAEDLLDAAGLRIGSPMAQLSLVASASDFAAQLEAVRAVNAAETRLARALVRDQEDRVSALVALAARLEGEGSTGRSEALIADAIPSAEVRLARLRRDFSRLQEIGQTLSGFAAAPGPAPVRTDPPIETGDLSLDAADPPIEPEAFVEVEVAAQLGLDLGGTVAIAVALGRAEAGAPGADIALRRLLLAHFDAEIGRVDRDIERLVRKRDRERTAADTVSRTLADPSAALILGELWPSVLIEVHGGVVKVAQVSPDRVVGEEILPLNADAATGDWRIREIETPEADRLVSDRQASWARALQASGEIARVANWTLLTNADSTYPELAGISAALAGSLWTMLVTLLLSAPVGVLAAVYLEEFAPRNRVTDFIEVNINNLAAVPSIVFGLLGAAVFINLMGLPRSAPLVGGLVLSLMTLPTIIIATRASLRAVPPSIRQGALAIGASPAQTVFQHVLPLAAPGILTGTIIGMAQALGETAPLLLIGMVAFVAEPPTDILDSATALPVLIYKWASGAERAWQPMTSAVIIVLLLFMFAMNAIAVYLRRRLERRW
ncbi:phosphate ABC transporter permease PstA [bacterium]|nr:phosphate ABC transporter permease PstA [bacterium]